MPLCRVALRLAYDGSLFSGWQMQNHAETVEGRLSQALSTATRHPVRAFGSGRTDAGVHALNQVAHADIPAGLDWERLRLSVNALAAPGIALKGIVAVPAHFHARHSASGKVYRYQIFNRPYPAVLAPQRAWWIRHALDTEAMRRAARALIGEHDFSAFRAAACEAKSPVRTVRRIEIAERDAPEATLSIDIEATAFLQHMVRIVVGTLVMVGSGRLPAEAIGGILAGRERVRAGLTAPPEGLHMLRVYYDLEAFPQLAAWSEE